MARVLGETYKVDSRAEKKNGDHGWHNIGVPLRVCRFRLTVAVRAPLGSRACHQSSWHEATYNGNHMGEIFEGLAAFGWFNVECRLVKWSAAQLAPT